MRALALIRPSASPHRLVCVAAAIVLGLFAVLARDPASMEAWLLAYVLLAGPAVGALGLLMIGHLLGEIWLHPVRDELEAIARSMPLVAIFGVPLLFGLDDLYRWARGATDLPRPTADYLHVSGFVARSIIYVVVWILLAGLVARSGRHRAKSAIGLMLLLPTVGLASIDWIASREPEWISSLYGFSFAAAQALAALGLALLITLLRQGHPPAARLRSLQSAFLSLALLTLWIWFSQFLIVWMADLPRETAWFFTRLDGIWVIVQAGVAVPALAVATIMFIPPRPGWTRICVASVLVLAQHLAHTVWLVRPGSGGATITWVDAVPSICMVTVWVLFVAGEIGRRPTLDPQY